MNEGDEGNLHHVICKQSDENSLSWICLPIAGLKGIPSFIFCALCLYMPVNKRKFEGVLSPKKGEQNDIQATEVY